MTMPEGYGESSTETGASSQVVEPPQGGSDGAIAADGASSTVAGSTEVIKDNPYWNNLLNNVPEQFHSQVKPILKEWDRTYGELNDKFAPYKKFTQQNVSAETLDSAYTLYNMLNNNPQEMYRRLGEMLGMTPQQAQQVVEQEQQQQQQQQQTEQLYGDDDVANDPRYQQMQQQLMQLQQFQQQQVQVQQQEQLTQHYTRQLDSEIKQIQTQHPNVNVGDLMNRFLAQMQRGEEPNIARAYQEQEAFVQNIIASQQRTPLPKVITPGGGSISGSETIPLKTQEDRVAAVEAMIRASQQQE